jgi:phosphatidylinositol-3,4,5-trisphosphate 3-phosphatase/dual-specificity protein phosphatase PTEN
MLFSICDLVSHYLCEDAKRIAVFHCNHGKGRTGTIICCFLLFMGLFKDYKEVMRFYAERRFEKDGYGVTQPCQIRYIQYFENYLINPKVCPQVLSIKNLHFKGEFSLNNPYIKIVDSNTNKIIYNTHDI